MSTSTLITQGARQKNVESISDQPSPMLLLHQALLGDVELRSVSVETARGLDPAQAAAIVDHYRSKGWTVLDVTPGPDGFSAIVAPTRDVTNDHRALIQSVIRSDGNAPMKKKLKRKRFLSGGEHSLFLTTETVLDDGYQVELPYGTFRVAYEDSPNSSNDGHGAITRPAAEEIVATTMIRPKVSAKRALATARRHLKGATHLQVFFVGAHGSSKGLHVIREPEDFQRQFGTDFQVVSDSENLKSEMWLAPGYFAGKVNIWHPRGTRSAVLTASEDLRRRLTTDVLGWDQTAAAQTAAFQRILAETRDRIANGQPFSHEDVMFASWTQDVYGEQRLYNSDEERAVAGSFPWTGSIHAKLYGGIGAYTAEPGSRVPLQAVMCILGGNGRYYGQTQPERGYLDFARGRDGRPHTIILHQDDYPWVMVVLDTSDNDGDLASAIPARDPHCYLSDDPEALWAMVLRTPASPGGVAWLRLRNTAWHDLLDAGAMPITVNGPVPYRDYMHADDQGNLPVHSLRPIGDMRPASEWDTDPESQIRESIHIRNQAALIGVFYRVMTAGHNADVLHLPPPQWIEDLYAENGMEPSTTAGSSTCFSDFVDSVGKQLNPPIEAMAEVLAKAVSEHGIRLDACTKQALWQPMFQAFNRTTEWDNRTIAQTLNRAFSQNCMGDHWRATQTIEKASAWFNSEFVKLQLMANGPATLLLAEPTHFPGDLVARITEVQTRISNLWAAKFANDRDIDALTKADPRDAQFNDEESDPQQESQFESWEMLTQQQAKQQKAAAYRHTADRVARVIAADLVEAAEGGHDPVDYFAAWVRLTSLATNRFGEPRKGYRQPPAPLNTTTLFRTISRLQQEHPEIAHRITSQFATVWPGHGPTALVKVEDPEALRKGERYEIRRNANDGQHLLCHKGKDPVTRVTAGAGHFLNLPLTYAGSPEPLDPTGEAGEQTGLHLFLISSVQPQTVSVPTLDAEAAFAHDEEVTIERESSDSGPVYHLATTRKHLEQELKAGRQASFNRTALDGVHELHLGRKFRYAGTASNGNVLLRSEHRKTSRKDPLVDSVIEILMGSAP